MKTGTGLLLMLGVMLSGCATTEELAGPETEQSAPELVVDPSPVELRIPSCFVECYFAFYSDPAKTSLVGECESGPGTWPQGCWGQQTQHRTGGCWRTCEPFFD